MTDNVIYQAGTLATPGTNTAVATDYAPSTNGSAHYQRMKLDIGPDGTSVPLAWGGTGLPLGTLPGTVQILGTTQPLAGSVHLASGLPGTAQVLGSVRVLDPVAVAQSGAWSVAVTGTTQPHGTGQALGTVQPLAGSVHVANAISGTVQPHGTGQMLGTVRVLDPVDVTPTTPVATDYLPVRLTDGNAFYTASGGGGGGGGIAYSDESPFEAGGSVYTPIGGFVTSDAVPAGSAGAFAMTTGRALHVSLQGTAQVLGSVRSVGTTETLGTYQPLAGSVHLATNLAGGSVVVVGSAQHGAAADGRPMLIAAFGSSGTQAAVDDGDSVRLWADLNGRLQTRGTIDSLPAITGTVQPHGTAQVLGSVRSVGTTEILGTTQPLAGSVHLASFLPGGSVSVQGYVAHDAAAAGNPVLLGAFGSSGAPSNVTEQDAVRLWADLAGRLQVVGSVTATPAGTVQALGTVRALIDAGTVQVLGSVQTHGTSQALGTVQPLAGSVHPAAALPGTSQISCTVRALPPSGTVLGETYFGTIYTAAANDVTLIAAPGAGTFIRIYDILVSGSAAGTVRILDNAEGTFFGHLHVAANGGWSFNSSRGIRTRAANRAILLDCSGGTWGVMINYGLET